MELLKRLSESSKHRPDTGIWKEDVVVLSAVCESMCRMCGVGYPLVRHGQSLVHEVGSGCFSFCAACGMDVVFKAVMNIGE